MADNATLMAYLVPRLTRQVENAATDALAYILNNSPGPMQALNELLQESGYIGPVSRLETQVTYEDGSRPDMAGYDENNLKRLLVEAKFWAALLEGQSSDYARLLDQPGPAALLFISPEVRMPTLWAEIERQMKEKSCLDRIESAPGVRRARVIWTKPCHTELQLILVSWVRLLDRMDALAGDDGVKSDIRQLRGLAQLQDAHAFFPVHSEELSPDLGRRVVWYNQLVDHAVDSRGVPEKWMNIEGLAATAQRYGYGRYLHFSGVDGDFWFGVNHERWAGSGDTPLWLRVLDRTGVNMDEIARKLKVRVQDEWIPVHIKTGVDYDEVLDDVVSKLKAIAKVDSLVKSMCRSN